MLKQLFKREAPSVDPAQDESFVSHLVELRDRMIRSLVVVLLLFGVCFYFSGDIMKFLSQPLYEALPPGTKPIFTDQAGAFFTLTKVSFLTALLVALPWVLYQAWAFVAPGLYEHEKRFALPLIVSSVFFMVVGISFAYLFVLPAAHKFFISFSAQTGAETLQDLQKYWDFTLSIFFGFGLTFEVPVVEMLLVKLGMVTQQQLRDARRYVIVGAFVVAAVLTPPDVLSQFMLAIPLCLLYELGIWLSGFITAHSKAPEAADETAQAASTDPR
ncbi:MAG TPA: twin-arginine translocase subunit TatC [Burkholderiaceae bacterium]|nr:twin-arginine translocase subunit TatC [Burkholderiaceae bacterium]